MLAVKYFALFPDSMSHRLLVLKSFTRNLGAYLLLCATALFVNAQSADINAPTPIRKSDLQGRIAARDLGDARLTNHYYAFTGTPGDLLITVQSQNLNGDIDVFTAGTLRPLLKLSLYAESNSSVTKGIYLRRREDLILRIEARSPNDDEGTYQIVFTGTFEPMPGGPDIAENETQTTETPAAASGRRGNRVNSVGARIKEPEPPVTEVAAAPSPEPTPEANPTESPSPTKKASPTQSARSRRPTGRRSTTATTTTPKPQPTTKQEAQPTEEAKTPVTEPEVASAPKPKPRGRSNSPRSGTTARPVKTPPATTTEAEPEPEIGPRLIIETNDGTLINRSMSTVRRVTVENGWVVIVSQKTGKIDRVLLANVVKMTIQP